MNGSGAEEPGMSPAKALPRGVEAQLDGAGVTRPGVSLRAVLIGLVGIPLNTYWMTLTYWR
ncbi:MAG TPA: hypothetical protein VM537_02765, partial [Anaerolineae bacterium]|nr:hypothetical protein [Anaerolineae bacterium]